MQPLLKNLQTKKMKKSAKISWTRPVPGTPESRPNRRRNGCCGRASSNNKCASTSKSIEAMAAHETLASVVDVSTLKEMDGMENGLFARFPATGGSWPTDQVYTGNSRRGGADGYSFSRVATRNDPSIVTEGKLRKVMLPRAQTKKLVDQLLQERGDKIGEELDEADQHPASTRNPKKGIWIRYRIGAGYDRLRFEKKALLPGLLGKGMGKLAGFLGSTFGVPGVENALAGLGIVPASEGEEFAEMNEDWFVQGYQQAETGARKAAGLGAGIFFAGGGFGGLQQAVEAAAGKKGDGATEKAAAEAAANASKAGEDSAGAPVEDLRIHTLPRDTHEDRGVFGYFHVNFQHNTRNPRKIESDLVHDHEYQRKQYESPIQNYKAMIKQSQEDHVSVGECLKHATVLNAEKFFPQSRMIRDKKFDAELRMSAKQVERNALKQQLEVLKSETTEKDPKRKELEDRLKQSNELVEAAQKEVEAAHEISAEEYQALQTAIEFVAVALHDDSFDTERLLTAARYKSWLDQEWQDEQRWKAKAHEAWRLRRIPRKRLADDPKFFNFGLDGDDMAVDGFLPQGTESATGAGASDEEKRRAGRAANLDPNMTPQEIEAELKKKKKTVTQMHNSGFNAGLRTKDCRDVTYPIASHPQYRTLKRMYPATDFLLRGKRILAKIIAMQTETEEMLQQTVLAPIFRWIREQFVSKAGRGQNEDAAAAQIQAVTDVSPHLQSDFLRNLEHALSPPEAFLRAGERMQLLPPAIPFGSVHAARSAYEQHSESNLVSMFRLAADAFMYVTEPPADRVARFIIRPDNSHMTYVVTPPRSIGAVQNRPRVGMRDVMYHIEYADAFHALLSVWQTADTGFWARSRHELNDFFGHIYDKLCKPISRNLKEHNQGKWRSNQEESAYNLLILEHQDEGAIDKRELTDFDPITLQRVRELLRMEKHQKQICSEISATQTFHLIDVGMRKNFFLRRKMQRREENRVKRELMQRFMLSKAFTNSNAAFGRFSPEDKLAQSAYGIEKRLRVAVKAKDALHRLSEKTLFMQAPGWHTKYSFEHFSEDGDESNRKHQVRVSDQDRQWFPDYYTDKRHNVGGSLVYEDYLGSREDKQRLKTGLQSLDPRYGSIEDVKDLPGNTGKNTRASGLYLAQNDDVRDLQISDDFVTYGTGSYGASGVRRGAGKHYRKRTNDEGEGQDPESERLKLVGSRNVDRYLNFFFAGKYRNINEWRLWMDEMMRNNGFVNVPTVASGQFFVPGERSQHELVAELTEVAQRADFSRDKELELETLLKVSPFFPGLMYMALDSSVKKATRAGNEKQKVKKCSCPCFSGTDVLPIKEQQQMGLRNTPLAKNQ
ncbi:unnamed protein product, partial [Amoebophrya sp. A120]|eukprot:GSA120T00014673001.1